MADDFKPASNWQWLDLLRTLFDFTATAGTLEPQDDLVDEDEDTPEPDPDKTPVTEIFLTPYQRLVKSVEANGGKVHDFRQTVRTSKQKRGRARGTRKLENVTCLQWHQMAAAIAAARRCLSIPVHGGVMWGNADVALLHPILAYLYGGHSANPFCIHIEFGIRAAGIAGDGRTFWRRASEKTAGKTYADLGRELQERMIVSGLALGRYYVEEHTRQCAIARKKGRNPRGIVAQNFHRNSHKSRTSDPGSRVALEVVKPLCDEFGHEFGGPVTGSGVETPQVWGGDEGVRYSGGVRGF